MGVFPPMTFDEFLNTNALRELNRDWNEMHTLCITEYPLSYERDQPKLGRSDCITIVHELRFNHIIREESIMTMLEDLETECQDRNYITTTIILDVDPDVGAFNTIKVTQMSYPKTHRKYAYISLRGAK